MPIIGADILSLLVICGAGYPILHLFRQRGHAWTSWCLLLVSLFAAFVLTLLIGIPLLTKLPFALHSDSLFIRGLLFVLICGGISYLCLLVLSRTRMLWFLPIRLLLNAAIIVTIALFLFAISF